MHPQLQELIEVCLEHRVGHIVLAGGMPPGAGDARGAGRRRRAGLLRAGAGDCPKLVRSGADAIVIEGIEAGGHIGPVSTGVLAQEILPHLGEVPVFVAGGIGRGEAILSYLEMGAAGCQLGTRFVCAARIRSRIRTSSRPSSAPRRATRCRRCSSMRASR